MKPYIFTERNGIYIIDLQKTVKAIERAYDFLRRLPKEEVLSSLLALSVRPKRRFERKRSVVASFILIKDGWWFAYQLLDHFKRVRCMIEPKRWRKRRISEISEEGNCFKEKKDLRSI